MSLICHCHHHWTNIKHLSQDTKSNATEECCLGHEKRKNKERKTQVINRIQSKEII